MIHKHPTSIFIILKILHWIEKVLLCSRLRSYIQSTENTFIELSFYYIVWILGMLMKKEILCIKNSKIIESYPFLGLGIVSSTMYPISVNRMLRGSCKQCMLNIVSILSYLKDANTVHYKRFYDKYISFTI